ncbi:hypothetical protein ACFL2D_02520 [Patescibacteria group bacterium]
MPEQAQNAPEEQPAQPVEEPKKKSKKGWLTCLLIGLFLFFAVIIIIIIIVGLGVSRGSKVSDYGNDVKAILEESSETYSTTEEEGADQSDLKRFNTLVENMESDADAQLAKLSVISVPENEDAEKLRDQTTEYFVLLKKTGSEFSDYLAYFDALQRAQEGVEGTTADISEDSSKQEVIAFYNNLHKTMEESAFLVRTANPPPALKSYNNQLASTLTGMDKAILKMKTALEKEDQKAFNVAVKNLNNTASPGDIKNPSTEEIFKSVISDEEYDRLTTLEVQLWNDANDLANTSFSF